MVDQVGIAADQRGRLVPGGFDQILVPKHREQPEAGPASRLRGTEHVTLAAMLQIELGHLKAVSAGGDRGQPGPGRTVRRRLGYQQAEPSRATPADPTAD